MYPAVLAACRGADAVIHSLLLTALGHHAARALNLPDFSALVFALFAPTAAFANPLFPAWRLGPRYNYLTHREFNRVFWHLNRLGTAWLRRKASVAQPALIPVLEEWPFWRGDPYLAEIAGAGCASCSWQTPILYGISPHVLPRPADWDANTHLTGYWFLDTPADYAAPPELERFLADGPPPVYVGFGSVISRDLRRLTRVAVEALAISRQRGVLLSGWGGLGAARDWPAGQMKNVYVLDSVPFDWLFARVTAAVHHGGVGTTAYALRAGIPSAFAPFAADQPFWARRLHALGASPAPVAPQNLTAARLARAITLAVEDEAMRAQARALGERIRAEDGVGAAVRLIESYLIFS
jgi:UDP:flavonoid glycosyltransferase YjiC (YdhE family)